MANVNSWRNYSETNASNDAADEESLRDALAAVSPLLLFDVALSCVGAVLNGFVLFAICGTTLRVPGLRLGLLSLCATDLLLSIANISISGLHYHWISIWTNSSLPSPHSGEKGVYHTEFCGFYAASWLLYSAVGANQFGLLGLACLQFCNLRWPIRVRNWFSDRVSNAVVASLWLMSFAVGFVEPIVVVASVRHPKVDNSSQVGVSRFCYQILMYATKNTTSDTYAYDFGQEIYGTAILVFRVGFLALVLAGLFSSYVYVAILVNRENDIDLESNRRCHDSRRVVAVMLLVTLTCLVSYVPIYTCHLLDIKGYSQCFKPRSFAVLLCIGSLAPIADPLLYTLRLKAVRQSVQVMLRGRPQILNAPQTNSSYASTFSSVLRQTET